MSVVSITGYLAIAVGIYGRIKRSRKGHLAYIFRGLYVLVWTANWYNSNY